MQATARRSSVVSAMRLTRRRLMWVVRRLTASGLGARLKQLHIAPVVWAVVERFVGVLLSRSTAAGAGVFVVVRRRTLHGANCAIAMRSAVVFNFRVHITINVCRQRSRSWRRSASSPYQPHRTAGTGLECRTRPIPIRLHHSVGIFAMSIADDAEQSHCTQRRMALRARSGRFGPACVSMRSAESSASRYMIRRNTSMASRLLGA